jgi:hypothetical protein
MIIRLKSLRLSGVLGLALLVGALALGNSPVRADDTETVAPSQSVEVATAQILGFVERLETCASEGRPIESCIEKPQIESPALEADQQPSALIEARPSTETDPPFAQTGDAIVVEVTQSVTIVAPASLAEEEHQAINDEHEAINDEREAINILATSADNDVPIAQTGAAIAMEITQSVTIAAPGQIAEDGHDPVSVAPVPVDDN